MSFPNGTGLCPHAAPRKARPPAALAADRRPAGGGHDLSHPSGGGEASKPAADASRLETSASGDQTSNVYADARANMLSPAVRGQRVLVYVPNHGDGTVSVIDPKTYRVIDTFRTGPHPQHVVPSYDLRTLWVNNNEGGNSLTPIDPRTGKRRGPNVPVADPYNMYFTPRREGGHYRRRGGATARLP